MSAALQFDEATHRYTLDGAELPSVTKILDDVFDEYRSIDQDTLRRAQERGTAVHKACELYDLEKLDLTTVDDSIAPYLESYIKFISDSKFEHHAVEQKVVSRKYGYAGTLDRLGVLGKSKRRCQIDLKSAVSVSRSVGPQTAAYEQAAREENWIEPKEIMDRYALQLRADGGYRLLPSKSPADFSVFLSALTIYKFKRGA